MLDYLTKVRKICLALPETSERISHGHPAFFVREKKTLAMFRPCEDPVALWCPAEDGALGYWKNIHPELFYYPPYMGPYGWVGMWLTGRPDWDLVDIIVRQAFLKIAPKSLSKTL